MCTKTENTMQQAPITDLVHEWKKGNQLAFNELFSICYQLFKHEVRKQKLKHDNEIKPLDICIQTTTSIVHDCYIKLSSHRDQVVCDRKDLYLLISQVVRSVIFDQFRKSSAKKRSGEIDLSLDESTPLEKVDDTYADNVLDTCDLHAKLHFADKSLSDVKSRCTDVLNLSVYAGLKPQEIADILDISMRTVHNDLNFAKAWYLEELSA